jgi:hypothetical protein
VYLNTNEIGSKITFCPNLTRVSIPKKDIKLKIYRYIFKTT